MKKLFFILTVLLVGMAFSLSSCDGNTPPPTQDPAISALQTQIAEMGNNVSALEDENTDLQEQLEEALKTEEVTEEPTLTPTATLTPTPEEPKYRCGKFLATGKIYQIKKNKNGIIQRNDAGNPLKDVLGEKQVEWFYKGQRTCVYKKWVQFDGGRMWKLWYNTKHLQTGEWLSHPEDCCYVSFNAFKPDDASYTLPIENQ